MVKGRNLLWWAMLCVGFIAMLVLLSFRIRAEENDHNVAAAIYYDDVVRLARNSREHTGVWLAALKDAGLEYVIFDEEPTEREENEVAAMGLRAAAAAEVETDGDYAFYLPNKDIVPETDLPLAMEEDDMRVSVRVHPDFDIDAWEGDMVKTMFLLDTYAKRYSEADDGLEIENTFYRGVIDRGMRLLILAPFRTEKNQIVTDTAVYVRVLERLDARLAERDITFGEGLTYISTRALDPVLMLLCSLLPAAVGIYVVCEIPFVRKWELWLCLFAIAVLAAGWLLLPTLMQTLVMLATAVVFSLATALWIAKFAKAEPKLTEQQPMVLAGISALIGLVFWSLIGGATVSALMSNRLYMIGGDIFSGVKLSMMLPLSLCFVLLAYLLIVPMLKSIRGTSWKDWIWVVGALAVVAAMYVVLKIRSGDVNTISNLESSMRDYLEYTLYARPRTKELLFTVPCVPVFVWACREKVPALQIICGMGACLEGVSVVNTFCHAVAPLRVSLARTLYAMGFGFVIGLVGVAVLHLVFKKIRKKEA